MSDVNGNGSFRPTPPGDLKNKERNDRFLKIVGVLVVAVLAIVAAIVFLVPKDINENAENEAEERFTVSSADKQILKENAENIISTSGSFGVNPAVLNGNIIHQVSYLASTESPGYKDYMSTRQDAYEQVRSFIRSGSELDYDASAVSQWDTSIERDQMWNLKVNKAQASVPDEGTFIDVDGSKSESVTVPVTYDSRQLKYLVTAEDTSWDGSYRVLEKNFNNNSADLVFTKQGNDWKLSNVRNSSTPVLLSISGSVSDVDYENSQFDFKQVDTIKPDKKPGEKK